LINFALMLYRAPVRGDRVEIARADCCHAEVHLHQFHRSSTSDRRTHLRSIGDPADVYTGWDLAHDAIVDQWHERMRRWSND